MSLRFPALRANEQRGSRPRCVLLTDGTDAAVAARITKLVQPFAIIDPARHTWMPRGLYSPMEAKLGEADDFLSPDQREQVTTWWLAVRGRANTPNWDLATTATIDGREGLVLIEAKAHSGELKTDGQGAGNQANRERIGKAVAEANQALSALGGNWALSCDSHYQLANRFAWSWKLASLGIPVVLIYLGFLNADEMSDQGDPFATSEAWTRAVRDHARGIVPEHSWEQRIDIGGIPINPVIRSLELPLTTR